MLVKIEAAPSENNRVGFYSLSADTEAETVLDAAKEIAGRFGHMFWAMEIRLSRMASAIPARWSPHEPIELGNFIHLIEAVQTAAINQPDQSGQVAALIWAELRSRNLVADLRAVCARLRDIDCRNRQNNILAGDDDLFQAASKALKEFAATRPNE